MEFPQFPHGRPEYLATPEKTGPNIFKSPLIFPPSWLVGAQKKLFSSF